MMRTFLEVFIGFFLLGCTSGESSFVVVVPKILRRGEKEKICVSLYGIEGNAPVTLTLDPPVANRITLDFNESKTSACEELDIEGRKYEKQDRATLVFEAKIGGTIHSKNTTVALRKKQPMTFIQTDKPWYLPGQTVKFRILSLSRFMKPVSRPLKDVRVVDPNGMVIQRWTNVTNTNGMADFELPLCKEPIQGTWKISSRRNQKPVVKFFQVKEYELPRFEVSLRPNISEERVDFKICATYSYGEPVMMSYDMVCVWKQGWQPFPITKSGKGLGCATATIRKSELKDAENMYHDTTMNVFVTVTEDGTGVVINGSAKVILKATGVKIEFTKKSETFHVGIPYYGEVTVTQGGHLLKNEKIKLCIEPLRSSDAHTQCEDFTTNENGYFIFSFLPKDPAISQYEIKAERPLSRGRRSTSAEYVIKRVLSPSDSALALKPQEKKYKCGDQAILDFNIAGVKDAEVDINYYVIARGSVLDGKQVRVKVKQQVLEKFKDVLDANTNELVKVSTVSLTFPVTKNMAPEFQVLAFFVPRNDGQEIVTASGKFPVEPCFPNEVKMNWIKNTAVPGKKVDLSVTAASGSVCGLLVVDKSVTFLEPEHRLKREDIFSELSSFKIGPDQEPLQRTTDSQYCTAENTDSFDSDYADYDEDGCSFCESVEVDPIASFDDVGLVVLSHIPMEKRTCKLEIAIMPRMIDVDSLRESSVSSSSEENSDLELRSYFPETWLWETFIINGAKNGSVTSYTAPHTITDWKGKAVCLHEKSGFGMSEDIDLRISKAFFVDFSLPYSVKKGETLSLKVSVFNYKEEKIEVEVTLETKNPSLKILNANTRTSWIDQKRKDVHTFEIQPQKVGMMDLEIQAVMKQDKRPVKDRVLKQLRVEPEGVMVEKTETALFCQNDTKKELMWKPDLPNNVVEGSERAWITASGDIMGAALSDLDNLVSLPTGCGEQNMVKFSPIVYVLKYMNATQQDDEELTGTAKKFLNVGYQRQLKYRHDDGSYSAFGKSDESGSMWLSAFVVRSFSAARQFVTIDFQMLRKTINWIQGKQNKATGCFPTVGKLISGGLSGGVGKAGSQAALTAYVLTSLLEPSAVLLPSVGSINKASDCILQSFGHTPYEQSLITYALVRYAIWNESRDGKNSHHQQIWKEARLKLEELLNQARKNSDGLTWWEDASQSKALSIEMTAYNILSLVTYLKHKQDINVKLGDVKLTVRSAVLWLTKQRNSNGGFVSTQDTVVGLQALSEYAATVHSRKVDIKADLKWIASKNSADKISISEENSLLLQKSNFDVVPSHLSLKVEAKSGCGLFQIVLRYNIPKPIEKPAFNISSFICDIDGKKKALVGYVQYEHGQTSNMAVVDIEIPSGYVADKQSLLKLQDDGSTAVKRTEYEKGHVNLYYDEVKDSREKFSFGLVKEFEVRDVKPTLTVAYDYYTPEKRGAVEWSIVEAGGEECNDLGS